jgi:hypothetical protein
VIETGLLCRVTCLTTGAFISPNPRRRGFGFICDIS